MALVAIDRHLRALEDFDEAIRLNAAYTAAYVNRGVLYGGLGQYERALEDFDAALAIDPEDARAHGNRAFVLTRMGRDDEAAAQVDRAVELGADRATLEQRIQEIKAAREGDSE